MLGVLNWVSPLLTDVGRLCVTVRRLGLSSWVLGSPAFVMNWQIQHLDWKWNRTELSDCAC